MEKLSDLLTIILIDVIKAQHQANEYSAYLSEKYYNTESFNTSLNLSNFPVPNSQLKNIEVEMVFDPQKILEEKSGALKAILERTLKAIIVHLSNAGLITIEDNTEDNVLKKLIQLLEQLIVDLSKNRANIIELLTDLLIKIFSDDKNIKISTNFSQPSTGEGRKSKPKPRSKSRSKQISEYEAEKSSDLSEGIESRAESTINNDLPEDIEQIMKNIIAYHLRANLPYPLGLNEQISKDLLLNLKLDTYQDKEHLLWKMKLKIDGVNYTWGKTNEAETYKKLIRH